MILFPDLPGYEHEKKSIGEVFINGAFIMEE
jgi:hypothetical protein